MISPAAILHSLAKYQIEKDREGTTRRRGEERRKQVINQESKYYWLHGGWRWVERERVSWQIEINLISIHSQDKLQLHHFLVGSTPYQNLILINITTLPATRSQMVPESRLQRLASCHLCSNVMFWEHYLLQLSDGEVVDHDFLFWKVLTIAQCTHWSRVQTGCSLSLAIFSVRWKTSQQTGGEDSSALDKTQISHSHSPSVTPHTLSHKYIALSQDYIYNGTWPGHWVWNISLWPGWVQPLEMIKWVNAFLFISVRREFRLFIVNDPLWIFQLKLEKQVR